MWKQTSRDQLVSVTSPTVADVRPQMMETAVNIEIGYQLNHLLMLFFPPGSVLSTSVPDSANSVKSFDSSGSGGAVVERRGSVGSRQLPPGMCMYERDC